MFQVIASARSQSRVSLEKLPSTRPLGFEEADFLRTAVPTKTAQFRLLPL